MECKNCGLDNRAGARFCKRCGKLVDAPDAVPAGQICPACGATAKSGARFCPRCGKSLPQEETPSPRPPAQPEPASQQTVPALSGYAGSSPKPPSAKRRGLGWIWWALAGLCLLCFATSAIAGLVFLPDLLRGESPVATPVPEGESSPVPLTAFDAQVTIGLSEEEVAVGQPLTITATLSNLGDSLIISPRYQLMGEWAPALSFRSDEVVMGEEVAPGASSTQIFVLEAEQPGAASFWVNVTMETEEAGLEVRRSEEVLVHVP